MKIICIGRNYSEHAKELNNPLPTSPLYFLKPDTAVLKNGNDFFIPDFTKDLHYECELVVKINKVGKHISPNFASTYYEEISLGIDFTARDIQEECKKKGLPWEMAKGFDFSAPISDKFIQKDKVNLENLHFSLIKNNEVVQKGNTKQMIFSINQVIVYVSKFITLKKGDLIFTGTPAGVGPVKVGDKLEGFIENSKMFEFNIK
jgi:acylpyruvate hydrolase